MPSVAQTIEINNHCILPEQYLQIPASLLVSVQFYQENLTELNMAKPSTNSPFIYF